MNYELAKKLKEAGWPQKGYLFYSSNETGEPVLTTEAFVFGTECVVCTADGKSYEKVNLCFAPTISELIEACGGGSIHIWNNEYIKDSWKAQKTLNGEIWQLDNRYKNPEEAVANLWLKLKGV